MDFKLIFAMITITLAFVFYTIGVFSERKAHSLNKKHVILFYCGLVFDTIGTTAMTIIASGEAEAKSSFLQLTHGVTGVLAILLMLFHALWATYVIYKDNDKQKKFFHKFSLFVWLIWLVPYIGGMVVGIFG